MVTPLLPWTAWYSAWKPLIIDLYFYWIQMYPEVYFGSHLWFPYDSNKNLKIFHPLPKSEFCKIIRCLNISPTDMAAYTHFFNRSGVIRCISKTKASTASPKLSWGVQGRIVFHIASTVGKMIDKKVYNLSWASSSVTNSPPDNHWNTTPKQFSY